jgi:hypothetical protein
MGAHRRASQDRLLAETEILPVADHLNMVCAQFLASASTATHTSNATVHLPTGDRPGRKATLCSPASAMWCNHILLTAYFLRFHLKEPSNLSTPTQFTANKRRSNNKLLDGPPPDIDPSEKTLPRTSRCTLTQLRSRKCKDLKSYQHQIGSSPDDLCPACHGTSHTTAHLFSYPALPTDLGVLDLWRGPREATYFLRTSTSFTHLPHPDPPPEPPLPVLGVPD